MDTTPAIFFNVQGREPQGVVPAAEYQSFQNEMKTRLEALPGESGQSDEIAGVQALGNLSPRSQRGS